MIISKQTLLKLEDRLAEEEGFRQYPYKDSVGKLTIGIGRNLDDVGIVREEAESLLRNDIARAESALIQSLPIYYQLDDARRSVLIDMCFNIGIYKVMQFKDMIKALNMHNYAEAADCMVQSLWAKQVGQRAINLARMMREG